MHKESHVERLLHIVAVTALLVALVEPATAALVAPSTAAALDADGARTGASRQSRHRLSTMDGHHVTGEIVLAAERATTGLVVAGVRLKAVGVVGLDVRLEVVGASECYGNEHQYQIFTRVGMNVPRGHVGHWYFLLGSSCMLSIFARWAVSEGWETADGWDNADI